MGWFDEQIRERLQSDQEIFEDSFVQIAGAVLGEGTANRIQDERVVTEKALDDIMKYYHFKPVKLSGGDKSLEEQMEDALRPTGLMTRKVDLKEGWYRDAFGPMLGIMKESGKVVALMPGKVVGYFYKDPETGKKTQVNRKTERLFSEEAMCFYLPLPMKKLTIRDLILYMRKSLSSSDIILIFLATLAVTLVGMLEPKAYKALTGPILESNNMALLNGMAVFLLSTAFVSGLLGAVRNLLMERVSTKVSLSVEAAVIMRILVLPLNFFRRFSSGELSNRAQSVGTLCDMLLSNVISTGMTSLVSLLYITQIFQFAPALVFPSLIIIVVTVGLSLAFSFMQIPVSRKSMDINAKEDGMNYAIINGIQKIRLSGAEKRAFARWARLYSKSAELDYNPPFFLKINGVILTGVSLVSTIIIYYLAAHTGVSPSEYYAFNAAYGRVMGAFTALAGIAMSLASIPPVLEMAEPILNTEPEVSYEKEVVSRISGNIEISHLSFRYDKDTPYILEDLSLKIKQGEYIAIVGRTGCGKSTLVRLLLGFEQPEKGAIYYGGRDLARLDPVSLRKKMGVVTQNGKLFQGDIFSNIVISAPQLTLDEAWEAAEIAGIAQDIREMPMGMQTMISEGQGGISGGQRQRIMIARAIAPKPQVLILDEATSALDNKTQKQVSDALDRLKCTRIVIAHRLSTIKNCDRILVLDDGRVIEDGTYEELINQNGAFADLVARQRVDLPV